MWNWKLANCRIWQDAIKILAGYRQWPKIVFGLRTVLVHIFVVVKNGTILT